ncbi:alpha-1A adrenergic receptor-like isoform X2 [Sitophilus oryzae]|uniref:Alpha-1A adrenergic receptor-like isoform X2 n=1 Tax=Sitophilus oryzae TaxID=7048 RepID=A0A6J2X709_SITOR|nr:alpha-1A adrenergic receptor-like isoform X2 [Sitophilus oryzae]
MGAGITRIDDSERSNVTEDFLRVIEVNRHVHYWYILIISVIAAIGNILVIRSVSIRKYKYLQKTCMISLALSDLLTVILFAMNYLDLLGKELITWSFGEFMCHALPVGQVVGNLASSIALVVIALDRYHSIIYALSKKWNPSWRKCLVGAVVLWIICIGISYPMATFYFHIPLRIPSGDVYLCTGTTVSRNWIKAYYVIINMLFFCPVISMFFWFYFKIAVIVWRHRKPISDKMAERADDSENISCSKISNDAPIKVIARPTPKRKNVHMERKKRTFKIVIILIFAFIGCRMPYWLFWVYKMVKSIELCYESIFVCIPEPDSLRHKEIKRVCL